MDGRSKDKMVRHHGGMKIAESYLTFPPRLASSTFFYQFNIARLRSSEYLRSPSYPQAAMAHGLSPLSHGLFGPLCTFAQFLRTPSASFFSLFSVDLLWSSSFIPMILRRPLPLGGSDEQIRLILPTVRSSLLFAYTFGYICTFEYTRHDQAAL
jgi:hypothetical protein